MAKKLNLSYHEIEEALRVFKDSRIQPEEVGYELLKAFGKSDADVRRYKEGKGVVKSAEALLIKGLFAYRPSTANELTARLNALKADEQVVKAAPKIVCVSDGATLLAYDMREKETYENTTDRLCYDFVFFYPLAGVERFRPVEESPADVKAAEKLARLHDELRAYNEFGTAADLHDLNIFIARLLFCFFAEDTGIFEEQLFTGSISRYTREDGSDLADYLNEAFNVMDTRLRSEQTLRIISQFPYVNGGLFAKRIRIPRMGYKARRLIIECGHLNWGEINPDIFGSMIQAVVNPEERANQGMHYTSVPNIMKVISPLFLDRLRQEYNALRDEYDRQQRLLDMGGQTGRQLKANCQQIVRKGNDLLTRISRMKFFDPACGSGNFLIITYKSLRLLEMDILRLQQRCEGGQGALGTVMGSVVRLSQFYGIELLDFPHEVAMLSLWLAEHQMNKKLHESFGVNTQALPLHHITQIVCGNACRLDWNTVCPHTKEEEVFVFGNPPYLGSSLQEQSHKDDMEHVFSNITGWKNLDYISCWMYIGAKYIQHTKAKCAFVTTNSICQGEQVSLLWIPIFNLNIEIQFAYSSFKWKNNARGNAGVTCSILGLANKDKENTHTIYTEDKSVNVPSISPYLISSDNAVIVTKRNKNLCSLPPMDYGSKPADGGYLILNEYEKEQLDSQAKRFLKSYMGSDDLINGITRYCLWIEDNQYQEAMEIPEIKERILRVRDMRLNSKKEATRKDANRAYQFAECRYQDSDCILVPRHSSERREYIPMGYLKPGSVIADSAFAIYNVQFWLFGILTSKMHMAWVRTVGGKLETRYRYSAQLCYNTFPFPPIADAKREALSEAAQEVLLTREDFPGKTLAELYDPDLMPATLREAHRVVDDLVDSCYPGYPFADDEARLECLFKMYERMIEKKTT